MRRRMLGADAAAALCRAGSPRRDARGDLFHLRRAARSRGPARMALARRRQGFAHYRGSNRHAACAAREERCVMKLGIPIYEGVNLLDVAGPLEMFFWANLEQDLQPILVSQDGSTVTSANKVCFKAQASFADTPSLDIVWVPGGLPDALVGIMKNPDSPYLKYLRQVAANAKWVCSVCEGALLLAQAGLLDGHKATTHWQFVKCLQRFPGIDVDTTYQRF